MMSHEGLTLRRSSLAPRDVVVEYHLYVLCGRNFDPARVVAWLCLRVDVDHLSVALVFKEQPRLIVGNHLEVGRVVARAGLRLPVVEGKVCRFGQQLLLALEARLQILRLEAVCKVDVPAGKGIVGKVRGCAREGTQAGMQAESRRRQPAASWLNELRAPLRGTPGRKRGLGEARGSPRDLLSLGIAVPQEDDRGELAVAHHLLALCEGG